MEASTVLKENTEIREQFRASRFENILKCVHCGLCLDSCPTYRELGDEKDSPRGRLYLMRGLWEGELGLEPEVIAPLDRCLNCRANFTVLLESRKASEPISLTTLFPLSSGIIEIIVYRNQCTIPESVLSAVNNS